jgi:hypothetical protein
MRQQKKDAPAARCDDDRIRAAGRSGAPRTTGHSWLAPEIPVPRFRHKHGEFTYKVDLY